MTYIKRFYYDTALSPSAYSLAALRELVDPTHILFGSDYPFAPAVVVDMERKTLDSSPIWDEPVKTGINRSHALALFPQFKQLGETQSSTPVFTDESLDDRGRRLLANATAEVVERIRDR